MKVRQFFTHLASVMSVAVIGTDQQCRDAYLVWFEKRAPRRALLEDALDNQNIEKFFRLEVLEPFLDQLESGLRHSDGVFVLEQRARVYFQVDEEEKFGVTSHVAGEMQKQVLPRLIAKLHQCSADELERDLGVLLASLFSVEFLKVAERIQEFRIKSTDQVTTQLFA